MQDHATSALIWNYKTREELREALENEIRSFTVDKVCNAPIVLHCQHLTGRVGQVLHFNVQGKGRREGVLIELTAGLTFLPML